MGYFVTDFRVRVGQREDDRVFGHALHHFGSQYVGHREPEKYISPFDGFVEPKNMVMCDSKGVLSVRRKDLNPTKARFATSRDVNTCLLYTSRCV